MLLALVDQLDTPANNRKTSDSAKHIFPNRIPVAVPLILERAVNMDGMRGSVFLRYSLDRKRCKNINIANETKCNEAVKI